MHFPIIELTETPDEELTPVEAMSDDSTLLEHTDYFGAIYDDDERRKVINSDWIKKLFDGIATVNTDDESITFLPAEDIRTTLDKEYRNSVEKLYEKLASGRISSWDFRQAGELWRDFESLFWFEGYGHTSMRLVEEAPYHAGKTYYFGNIIDAHF